MSFSRIRKIFLGGIATVFFILCISYATGESDPLEEDSAPVVCIAWRSNTESETYKSVLLAIERAGGQALPLPQIESKDISYDKDGKIRSKCLTDSGMLKKEYAKKIRDGGVKRSNAEEIIRSNAVRAVIFTGGSDISPSLYETPDIERNNGEPFDPESDVSDYLLMSCCLERDIPVLGISRGMNMMAIIAGAEMIQDLPAYYLKKGIAYGETHRMSDDGMQDFATHGVQLVPGDSLFRSIIQTDVMKRVPSWHHQAVVKTKTSRFTVTGLAPTQGTDIIEAIEIPGKRFALGLQFNPEIVISGNPKGWKKHFSDYDTTLRIFQAIVNIARPPRDI